MVGLSSYESPQKQAWRGWQWNQVVAHLPEFRRSGRVPSKGSAGERLVTSEKTVLYLAGPTARDLDCAVQRGFHPTNVIAIDLTDENIVAVRERGGIGICDDLNVVLRSWPADWHIDVVIADFCCGLDKTAVRFMNALFCSRGVSHKTVISLNLQRGRDKFSDSFRKWQDAGAPDESLKKNRAWQWLMAANFELMKHSTFRTRFRILGDFVEANALHSMPRFQTYCGSRVLMDSMVLNWPSDCILEDGEGPDSGDLRDAIEACKRKVAASRAVRTAKRKRIALPPKATS